jgi:ABC-2 type transport system permease protein
MTNTLHLYLRYLGVSVRGQMEYRASFFLRALAQFIVTGIEFVAVWALFHRFGRLGEWSLREVALFYGVAQVSWVLADFTTGGFDFFGEIVKRGDFDRLLLRPRSLWMQLMGQDVRLRAIGRAAQGAAVLAWSGSHVDWSPATATLLVVSVLCGAMLMSGLVAVQATICFWTTESIEVMNVFIYGGVEAAGYPLAIYRPWFRRFFTLVVPLACVNYYPVLIVLGKADPLGAPAWVGWLTPLAGPVFLLAAVGVWRIGVRRYQSTGS